MSRQLKTGCTPPIWGDGRTRWWYPLLIWKADGSWALGLLLAIAASREPGALPELLKFSLPDGAHLSYKGSPIHVDFTLSLRMLLLTLIPPWAEYTHGLALTLPTSGPSMLRAHSEWDRLLQLPRSLPPHRRNRCHWSWYTHILRCSQDLSFRAPGTSQHTPSKGRKDTTRAIKKRHAPVCFIGKR